MKFAIKCSYVEIEGVGGRAVAKDPVTDRGKRNKPGRLKLIKTQDDKFRTVSCTDHPDEYANGEDQLVTVFENGQILHEYSLETIRATCDIDPARLDSMQIIDAKTLK